jgi:hypothetical protein
MLDLTKIWNKISPIELINGSKLRHFLNIRKYFKHFKRSKSVLAYLKTSKTDNLLSSPFYKFLEFNLVRN